MRDDDDLIIQLMLGNPPIAKLTEDAVGKALDGFQLAPRRDMKWIARAVQGALYPTLVAPDDGPQRQANKVTRRELLNLSKRAGTLWRSLQERSNAADEAIFRHSFREWLRTPEEVTEIQVGEPPAHVAFSDAVEKLDWLASFLRRAANDLQRQGQNWKRAEGREIRINRAHHLSGIYETAFETEPTVNDFPAAKSLGPWADFYQRIVALAFGERATPDLRGVLKEARRRHLAHRVIFGAGVIPD